MTGNLDTHTEDDLVGSVLNDQYELTGLIGEGGCADVYKAIQRNVNSEVAVKVLHTRANTETTGAYQRRFIREVQVVARIRHPGVVRVYDFGFHKLHPYIVMELLEGRTVHQELKALGALAVGRSVRITMMALDGLAAAHKYDIVHRDLKPSNLYLTKPGSPDEKVSILDFGLALPEDSERVTKMGHVNGTPQYLAPEYVKNNIVSRAMDIYQMGLILVEMVTGRPAVDGVTTFECMTRHAQGELEIPGWVQQGELGPIVAKATALEPEDRYEDVAEFRAALARLNIKDDEEGYAWQGMGTKNAPATKLESPFPTSGPAHKMQPTTQMMNKEQAENVAEVQISALSGELSAADLFDDADLGDGLDVAELDVGELAMTELDQNLSASIDDNDDFDDDDFDDGEPTVNEAIPIAAPIILNEGRVVSSVRRPGSEAPSSTPQPGTQNRPKAIPAPPRPTARKREAGRQRAKKKSGPPWLFLGLGGAGAAIVGVAVGLVVLGMVEPQPKLKPDPQPVAANTAVQVVAAVADEADGGTTPDNVEKVQKDEWLTVKVVVTVEPDTAVISQDDTELGSGTATLTFEPGDRARRLLKLQAPGYQAVEKEIGPDGGDVHVVLVGRGGK